ncbi:hypothetical protein ACFV4Q_21760 [Streptomyces nojiriensis]|uniref:hypothetical protein n=1 Tax=Streptomyces nojiriensis TaxID=66374 RepID=UPI0036589D7C
MNDHDILQNPHEHVRFAVCLDKLGALPTLTRPDLVGRVLTDPDQAMARSAVLRHLDRRAACLCPEPAYEKWAQTNWLQLRTAAGTNTEAIEILAEAGRTKRIRNPARSSLRHQGKN